MKWTDKEEHISKKGANTMTVQNLKEWPYIKLEIARLDKIIMSLEERFCKSGADWLIKDIVDNKNKRLSLLEEIREIEAFLCTANRRDRQIIRYRYEDRLSWQEIADKLGERVTADGVRQAHYRCLKNSICRFPPETPIT